MKKLLFGLIVTIMFGIAANAQKVKEVGVKATFEIGRNSKNCNGLGICTKKTIKVEISIKVETKLTSSRSGLKNNQFYGIIIPQDLDTIRVYMTKENVDAIKKFTKNEDFIVDEDFLLNDDYLNLSNYVIKKGKYNYIFAEEYNAYYLEF